MDLSAYSLQKLNREKRERQPNWTESEKQLLLSLTRMHQSILENKGSDTMTIKRKSLAWDDIAIRMQAAGFNRSKERLKQQLGRIRAAEAKKLKDAMERKLPGEQVSGASGNISFNNLIIRENINTPITPSCNDEFQPQTSSKSLIQLPESLSLTEEHCIKTENTPPSTSAEENEGSSDEEITINTKELHVSSCIVLSTSPAANSNGNDLKLKDQMHFMVENVQSLAAETNVANDIITSECTAANVSDVTSTVPCSANSSPQINNNLNENSLNGGRGNEENVNAAAGSNTNGQKMPSQFNRGNYRTLIKRTKRIKKTLKRDQGLRQLYMYRIAVERERLRNLKLQQKRDRILYRKDVEIQNLKLQILRNLTNQNREANRINL